MWVIEFGDKKSREFFMLAAFFCFINRVIRLVPADKSQRARLIPCRSQGQ